jgi:hypothetical protein
MKLLLFLALVAVIAFSAGRVERADAEPPRQVSAVRVTYQGKNVMWWARRAVQARRDANARGRTIKRLRRELANHAAGGISPTLAIRIVFGPYAQQALRVAWCESRWYTGAQNGQYLGLFQMGSYARGRYGHAHDALGQAQAAYRYFVDSGRDWSPWSCKP